MGNGSLLYITTPNFCMLFRLAVLYLMFLMTAFTAAAQLCQGPAADPVAVIHFGSARESFATAGKFGAEYQSTDEACTPEGTIALRPRAFMCKPEWQVTPADHTSGDELGNFLMVSARPGNTDVFRDTVRGLCPGTVFNYEMWIINLLVPNACDGQGTDPDLLVSVLDERGNLIAASGTGAIKETEKAEWFAHRFQFQSPASRQSCRPVTLLCCRCARISNKPT